MRRSADPRPNQKSRPTRVLIVSQWYDPEPTFKGALFATELRRLGFDVRVLTGFPNYPGGRIYAGYRVRLFERENIDGTPVLRVPLYPSHDSSGFKRALNYVSFALSASIGALFVRRPDVAYVYHPPATVGMVAGVLRVFRGVPYVYDVQDLWPDTLSSTGMVNNPRVLGVIGRLMQFIYRGATKVVVLSEGFKSSITSRGLPHDRIEVIPNWADESQISVPVRRPSQSDSQIFKILFAGNIGHAQALEVVLDAAELLKEEYQNVRFVLLGGGVRAGHLKANALSRGLGNVQFLPRRHISEMGPILGDADALLIHLKRDPLFAITVPSKTQAYLMAGRPILNGVPGDTAKMVAAAGAGYSFHPEDPQSLASAVKRLVEMNSEERERMGSSGRIYYDKNLSLRAGAARFARLFEEVRLERPRSLAAKRIFDMIVSVSGLVIASLPMLAIGIVVKARMGSPVIFRQERPGKDGVPFTMFKFRTMSDERGLSNDLLSDGERLTKLGAFLRSTSLDELPELWNVARGDMSLVGPRPLLLRYTPFFSNEERLRLRLRPGITGWAQINGRNHASWDQRLSADVWYVRNRSFRLDLIILWRTLASVFRRDGVEIDPRAVMKNLDEERSFRGGV